MKIVRTLFRGRCTEDSVFMHSLSRLVHADYDNRRVQTSPNSKLISQGKQRRGQYTVLGRLEDQIYFNHYVPIWFDY